MWWVVLVLHLHLPHWDLVRWISFNCLVLPTRQCLDAYLCFVMLILWLVFSLTLHCSHLYWVPWIALNCFALYQVVFQRSAKTNMLIWAQLQCNFQYSCNCIYDSYYYDIIMRVHCNTILHWHCTLCAKHMWHAVLLQYVENVWSSSNLWTFQSWSLLLLLLCCFVHIWGLYPV